MNTKCETITHLSRHLDASHLCMKLISISLRRAKQMRKIKYNRAFFISHKKPLNPDIFTTSQ